jgi:hypothetical protein
MQLSTHYDIFTHWAENCETELQINNLIEAIEKRFVIEERIKEDILDYIKKLKIRRSWVASKVAQRDYTDVSNNRMPACDEFIEHKGAY